MFREKDDIAKLVNELNLLLQKALGGEPLGELEKLVHLLADTTGMPQALVSPQNMPLLQSMVSLVREPARRLLAARILLALSQHSGWGSFEPLAKRVFATLKRDEVSDQAPDLYDELADLWR